MTTVWEGIGIAVPRGVLLILTSLALIYRFRNFFALAIGGQAGFGGAANHSKREHRVGIRVL